MKKKLLLTSIAAAAMIFTGASFDKAEAAQVNCQKTSPVTYQTTNFSDVQKIFQQYFAKYNIQVAKAQYPVNFNVYQLPVQQKVQQQKPVQQTVQKQQKSTQPVQSAQKQTTTTAPKTTQATTSVSAFEKKVVDLTNAERAKQGLKPLTLDVQLSKVARIKSQDMHDKNYFDHNSPTYGSPFDMMKSFGISYKSAGENIAMGQTTPEQVVQAWMNSAGHRANILNSSYTHIGVGYVASGNYWTQQFIGK